MLIEMKKHIAALILIAFAQSTAYAGPGDSTKTSAEKAFKIESTAIANQMDSLMMLHVFQSKPKNQRHRLDTLKSPQFADSVFVKRLAKLNSQTPLELSYNPYVKTYIDLYTQRRRKQVMRMLALAEYYFPMFEEILDKHNMPLELKYLAVVESALNPQAKSRVGATGLWQFMYGTGKLMGLNINSYVDERSDPYKSTEAACQYMLRLYKMFGDWNLVLAAYNSGPGNVNKAIRRSGGKTSYWELRPYLPKETAGYVPAFIAAVYTMSYAKEHNLYATMRVPYFAQTDTSLVRSQISFDQLNMWLGIDKEVVAFLNPSYKHEIIPVIEGQKHYLVLPRQQMGLFIDNEDSLYTYAQTQFKAQESTMPPVVQDERTIHRVKSGESLGVIANRYKVSVGAIKRWNGLRSNTIHPGQRLTIYSAHAPSSSTASAKPKTTTDGEKTYYVVQKGDTLYDIAKRYPGVSATDLSKWNNISGSNIKPGMKLIVQIASN